MVKILQFRRSRLDDEQLMAAARVDVADPNQRKKLQTVRITASVASKNAWKWYDNIGELHYGINHTARVAGHAMIVPKRRTAKGVGARVADRRVQAVYDGLWSPLGGQRHLIESFIRLRKLKAHAHLVRNRDEDGGFNGYDWVSDDEMIFDGDVVKRMTLPAADGSSGDDRDSFTTTIANADYLGHVWTPHPRFSDLPDSPLAAIDDVCEELYLLTKGVRSKLMSRLAMAGLLYLPTEISEVIAGLQETTRSGKKPFSGDAVLNALVAAFLRNMENHDDAVATMPIMLRGPAAFSEAIRHVTIDREIYETDMKLRSEALNRMLLGLDLQPTSVLGNGDSNHWDAWADRDEELRSNVVPELEAFCFAMDILAIQPALIDAGVPDALREKTMPAADLSGATSRPNQAEDAKNAYDRGTLSPEGLRALTGISEEYAPSEEEYARWFGAKHGDPYMAIIGLGLEKTVDLDKTAAAKPAPGPAATNPTGKPKKSNATGDQGAPGNSESDTPKSKRPAA